MILRAIGAIVVSVPIGGMLAGVISALAGIWAPELALATIPATFLGLMVLSS
ncbi:hypothetical protein KU306_12130 [Haloferax larsenii]|uniref:Uncharacterized protein n=1 Tax=Haloferax larsenii TaxID=302484 RepID=A0ABY5RDG7_HALLR|nr:hypothetical protein [Haloferax larsenii]UVE49652.1 hypothetical protein KU306_12130 [Haloferax larsenii]